MFPAKPLPGMGAVASAMSAAFALGLPVTSAATIGVWATNTPGTWTTVGPSGWTNGTMPNAIGDVASSDFSSATSSLTLTQNVAGGVTVGTISLFGTGTGDRSWTIAAGTNGVILNQDGPGPLRATISNSLISSGTPVNSMVRISGDLTFADDIFISNTSNSRRTVPSNGGAGPISFTGRLFGTGNVFVSNEGGSGPDTSTDGNNPLQGAVSFAAQGAFNGNTTILKGAATYTRGDAFGPQAGNVITIGSAGGGSATLVQIGNGAGFTMENNIVIAGGTGGTVVFGSVGTPSVGTFSPSGSINIKSTFPGSTVTLNGDLSLINAQASARLYQISNPVVGVGKLTKIGLGDVVLSGANTYAGGTLVSEGKLIVGAGVNGGTAPTASLGSGNVEVDAAAISLTIDAGVTDAISDLASLTLDGGGTLGVADNGFLSLGDDINETVGSLVLGGVLQGLGTYGSTASGAQFQNDEFFAGTGIVSVVPEPTALPGLALSAAAMLVRRRRAN